MPEGFKSDHDYFASYSDPGVHRLMIADHPRTDGYRRAIEASVRERTERTVRSAMGEGVEVEVVQVAQLPVSANGKTPWIVSEI